MEGKQDNDNDDDDDDNDDVVDVDDKALHWDKWMLELTL